MKHYCRSIPNHLFFHSSVIGRVSYFDKLTGKLCLGDPGLLDEGKHLNRREVFGIYQDFFLLVTLFLSKLFFPSFSGISCSS